MKKITVISLIACFLLAGSGRIPTLANNPSVHDTDKPVTFGLQVMPGCEKILLSWQEVENAIEYNILRDGEVFGQLSDTLWIDTKAGEDKHTYQIVAINKDYETITRSWEIEGQTSCFDPSVCEIELNYTLDSKQYTVNGIEKDPMDTAPVIMQGRMYLVIRYVTQEVGAEIAWDGNEKKVTITTADDKVIELWIGRPLATVDGSSVAIDPENYEVTPCIINGRTLLPMRFVAEQLGATDPDDIIWNNETKTVTLKITDAQCPEPDVFCLTVIDTDSTKWLVKCIDSARNHVDVLLNQEYCKYSATLESGDLVRVTGESEKENKYTYSIKARWIEPVSNDVVITCFPTYCVDGELRYIEDKKEKTLNYESPISEIESSEGTYAVSISYDPETSMILWWEPVIYLATDRAEDLVTHSVHVSSVDEWRNRIRVSYNDGTEEYEDWMYMPVCSKIELLDFESCYKLEFTKNYLGIRVAKPSIRTWDCTIPFNIKAIPGPVLLYPNASCKRKFVLTNLSDEKHEFNTSFVLLDDDNKRLHESSAYEINKKQSKEIVLDFSAPADTGDFKVGLKVVSGLTAKTCWADMKCEPIEFDLELAQEDMRFHLNEPGKLDFYITNIFDCMLGTKVRFEVSNPSLDMPEGWEELNVLPNKRDKFTLPLLWNDTAMVDTETEFTIVVSAGDVTKSRTVVLKAMDYIPPKIIISTISNDNEKLTTVYGDVNWNELDPDKVIVNWGDGETSEGLRFPFEHRYDNWGNYTISIEAHSKEGAVGTYQETYLCEEPPPQPPVIRSVNWDPVMPDLYTIEITVKVDWGSHSKGFVRVDWGDGDITKSSTDFHFKHEYPDRIDIYDMEIVAVSKDDTESKPVKYELFMLGIMYIAFRIQ